MIGEIVFLRFSAPSIRRLETERPEVAAEFHRRLATALVAQRSPISGVEPVDVLECGDKVVARVRVTGTNQGEFLGGPATGKAIDVQLIDIIRIGDDGLAHEHWGVMDQLTMLQQLGLGLAPEGPPG